MMISGERWTTATVRRLGREGELRPRHTPALSLADFVQLALDCSSTAEHAPVHRLEPAVRCVEHEAARDADGDADRATVELDCETLGNHEDSAPGEQRHAHRGALPRMLATE